MNISFKSILAAGLAGVLALACGRYDDSELRDKINDIEGRLARLEKLVEQANQDISALQVLTAGLDGKVYVTGFEELADGYRISFSNGKVATIRNGKDGADGHTPAIGIKKDTDEVYYWTVDGEWLLDAQGNKVRVTGKDGAAGADGITPQLKIEDGYWYVSTDEGKSWTKLGKATGEDGADGQDGDSLFKDVTYDADYVYITLADGTVLTLSRHPQEEEKPGLLAGNVIGTALSVDYASGNSSTTVNTKRNAFDGDFDTFFASFDRSRTWAGLDLGDKYVINRVGVAPRVDHESRVVLGLFEGANQADFSDALPLAIVREPGKNREMQYIDVQCSRGFRYVRYVGPNDVRCNVAELEFYGEKGEGDDSRLCQLTNLPTVVINTAGAQDIVSKTEEIASNVYIISEGGTQLLATAETGVRGRGNASWGFPKKPYRLKFAEKQSPLGAPASAKKWTLISNYGDKTLMRNILTFEVSRRLGMAYTPFCTPVDVILNGEYEGCYQLCDQVEVGNGRVDAKKGYLIEIDAYAYDEEVYFVSPEWMPVTVKYPDEDDITPEQLAFIEDYFTQMEKAVFAVNYKDPEHGYRRYLDLDSFLKNFIIGEFCGNTDTYWSVYMYKDGADGKLFTGPAWDYDLAFENDNRTYPINKLSGYIYATNGSVAADAVRNMVTRIVKTDTGSRARLAEIWDQTKESLASLNDYVDETAALLDESQQLNFKRWPILNQKVHQNPRALGSYEAEVDAVKTYITGRLERFDYLVHN